MGFLKSIILVFRAVRFPFFLIFFAGTFLCALYASGQSLVLGSDSTGKAQWPTYSHIVTGIVDTIFLPQPIVSRAENNVLLRPAIPFEPRSMDIHFYYLAALFLLVGILLRAFPKYFNDLLRIVGRSGFRQKSIRDQLLHNKLASLFLNFIFFVSAGTFVFILSQHYGVDAGGNSLINLFICIGFLVVVYGTKYLALLAGGWIFSSKELAANYSFVIFFVNKIAGLVLLPVTMVLWLGRPSLYPVFLIISLIIIGILYFYRYLLVFPIVRHKSGISGLHFFIYLCGFEILPIVLLVKILVYFLNASN